MIETHCTRYPQPVFSYNMLRVLRLASRAVRDDLAILVVAIVAHLYGPGLTGQQGADQRAGQHQDRAGQESRRDLLSRQRRATTIVTSGASTKP